MKKYLTDGLRFVRARIDVIEVERESEQCVWIGGRRSAKARDFGVYHDTWEQAHAFLMAAAESKVLAARRQLEMANSTLGNIKGMKQTETA